MSEFDFDIGVIGGGAAGLTVAAGTSQLGAKTLLVEQEKNLGGDCLHYGCVPSKTLIKSARVYHRLKSTQDYGLPVISRPPVEFSAVSARIRSVINEIQKHDSVERFCHLGARVLFGHAEFVDEHTIDINGQKHSAAKWVIATGSSASVPPVTGLSEIDYLTNREIFSLDTLPTSLIILGGGPIALEMAQAFNRLGTKVDVIQRSDQILSREDVDMAETVQQLLAAEGINFHLKTELERVRDTGVSKEVLFKDSAGKSTAISAEHILVALGRSPNVAGMGLEKIGLDYNSKGIKVDARLRTSFKHIYAAGDITGQNQFTHAAGYEGGIVISNAVFHLPRKTDYSCLPWCTYIEPELANVGMNEKMARSSHIDYDVWIEEFKDNDRSLAEGERSGKIKLLLDKKEKPIGIQILGAHAGELISEWVAVMNSRTKLATLASAIHPYPTLAEINKRVAGAVLSKKIFSSKVKKALSFFFNLKGRACEL